MMMRDVAWWCESAGAELWGWVVRMNLWIAALVLAVIVVDRLLERRVSAAWRIGLYGVVAVRLALPLGWASPVGIVAGDVGSQMAGAAARPARDVPVLSDLPIVGYASRSPEPLSTTPELVPVSPLTWRTLVLGVYGAGVTGLALVLWRRGRAARRVVLEAKAVDVGSAEMRVRSHPSAGPILVGVVRPTLVAPESLVRRGGDGEWGAVLAHERAHVSRGDHVLAAVMAVGAVMLWPVVGVWVAAARVRGLMEQAADERALRGADVSARAAYGAALVRMARDTRRAAMGARLAPSAGLGFVDGVESRVKALTRTGRWGRGWQAGVVAGAALAMIACAGSRTAAIAVDELALPEGLRGAMDAASVSDDLVVRITVLSGVPKHAKLSELATGQQQEEGPEGAKGVGDGPARSVPTLTAAEALDVVRAAREQGVPPMLTPVDRVARGKRDRGRQEFLAAGAGGGTNATVERLSEWTVEAGGLGDRRGAARSSSVVQVDYRERQGGEDVVWGSTGNVIVPHGESVWMHAKGKMGAPTRLVLVSVEPAMAAATEVDPSDDNAYPMASTTVWVMELREPVAFETLLPRALEGERSGEGAFWGAEKSTKVVVNDGAGRGADRWMCVVPEDRLIEFGDALTKAGARHVALPALVGRVGAALTAAPGTLDKASSSMGPYGVTALATTAKGDASVLTGAQIVTLAEGSTRRMSTFEHVRLERGEALAVMQAPAEAGGAWVVTVYTPTIIERRGEYPFQTADPLMEEGLQVDGAEQRQVAPRAR